MQEITEKVRAMKLHDGFPQGLSEISARCITTHSKIFLNLPRFHASRET